METINHEYYVSLEVANLLKKAGFVWECEYCYINNNTELFRKHIVKNYTLDDDIIYLSPTLSVAQRWLREVKNIHINIGFKNIDRVTYTSIVYELIVDENSELVVPEIGTIHFCPNNLFFRGETKEYENPDDALSDAILLALKYLTLEKSEYSEYYTNYLKGK